MEPAVYLKNDSVARALLDTVGGIDEVYAGLHKYDDTDIAIRMGRAGAAFYHSKLPAIRNVQVRDLMLALGRPHDAEERGRGLLREAYERVGKGIVSPRVGAPR